MVAALPRERTESVNRDLADGALSSETRGVRPQTLIENLGISKNIVYSAIAAGEMKALRFGRSLVIPESEVTRWLQSKQIYA